MGNLQDTTQFSYGTPRPPYTSWKSVTQTHVEEMTIQCRWLFQFFLCIYSFLQFIQTFLYFFSEQSGCSAEEPLN